MYWNYNGIKITTWYTLSGKRGSFLESCCVKFSITTDCIATLEYPIKVFNPEWYKFWEKSFIDESDEVYVKFHNILDKVVKLHKEKEENKLKKLLDSIQ